MSKIDRKIVRDLAQNGVLRTLQEVAEELAEAKSPPKYMGQETMFELGRYWGEKEAIDGFFEELYNLAQADE